jgi:hypothetical protein
VVPDLFLNRLLIKHTLPAAFLASVWLARAFHRTPTDSASLAIFKSFIGWDRQNSIADQPVALDQVHAGLVGMRELAHGRFSRFDARP